VLTGMPSLYDGYDVHDLGFHWAFGINNLGQVVVLKKTDQVFRHRVVVMEISTLLEFLARAR
jgi:hypothetical protein